MNRKPSMPKGETVDVEGLRKALEGAFPDGRWLRLLEVFLPTGVADYGQMRRVTGHRGAAACGYEDVREVAHARAVLDVRLAAEAAGLLVRTTGGFWRRTGSGCRSGGRRWRTRRSIRGRLRSFLR